MPPLPRAAVRGDAKTEAMRGNARVLFALFESLSRFIVPGQTGVRVQEFCLEHFRRFGMRSVVHGLEGFPAAVCVSRNETAAHGLPDLAPWQPGDIVTVDLAARRGAWCADAAWTWVVPGGDGAAEALRDAAWRACLAGARAGGESRSIAGLGRAVRAACAADNVRLLSRFGGHGLGRGLHEEPHYNYAGLRGPNDRLADGLVLNVEPVVADPACGEGDGAVGPDGWGWVIPAGRRSAQFELSLALLPGGGWEILNLPDRALLDAAAPPF